MMKIKSVLMPAAILCAACAAQAVSVSTNDIKNKGVFGISFPSGPSIYMNSMSVSSISLQDYISGTTSVTEIVIDSQGGVSQVRIYHVEPANAAEAAEAALSKAPGNLSNLAAAAGKAGEIKSQLEKRLEISPPTTDQVYKQYPQTTHTRTVEFAVDSLKELTDLYKALVKDYAGTDTAFNGGAKDKQTENLPDRNTLGGKLYKVQRGSEQNAQ